SSPTDFGHGRDVPHLLRTHGSRRRVLRFPSDRSSSAGERGYSRLLLRHRRAPIRAEVRRNRAVAAAKLGRCRPYTPAPSSAPGGIRPSTAQGERRKLMADLTSLRAALAAARAKVTEQLYQATKAPSAAMTAALANARTAEVSARAALNAGIAAYVASIRDCAESLQGDVPITLFPV